MANRLTKKVALVTGASRGIGREIALSLGREGALVAVHYSNSEKAAKEIVEVIEKSGGKAFPIRADLSKLSEINAFFVKLDAELTRFTGETKIDILVNNAGIAEGAPFPETSEALFDKHFDINVKALFFVTQQAWSRLRAGGRVINISSVVARLGFDAITAYAATKGAVNTLTIQLAALGGPREITVNSVSPGAIDTDMNASWIRSSEGQEFAKAGQLLKRVGKPQDIAGAVLLLALPESGWITGQVIEASGGAGLK